MVYNIIHTLVATTAGSSAAGVELPTDDCRQPAGITDENSFFFLWRETIFLGKKFFFDSKNDAFYTKNGAFLHLLLVCTIFFVYIVYTLFVRVPVRFSDCSLTVPSHHVLVPLHHGLPQNEVAMGTNSFFHSWLCQSVPAFAVYPPCDAPHMIA